MIDPNTLLLLYLYVPRLPITRFFSPLPEFIINSKYWPSDVYLLRPAGPQDRLLSLIRNPRHDAETNPLPSALGIYSPPPPFRRFFRETRLRIPGKRFLKIASHALGSFYLVTPLPSHPLTFKVASLLSFDFASFPSVPVPSGCDPPVSLFVVLAPQSGFGHAPESFSDPPLHYFQ